MNLTGALILTIISLSGEAAFCSNTITIVFTTKNDGTLEDCDCEHNCQGGLPERMTLLTELRAELERFILVDGGDFFTTMGRQRKDEYVIQAYESFGYDAITIGEQEFVNGWPFFQKKCLNSNLKLISANLVDKSSGRLLANPYLIKKIDAIRVGIIGIASSSVFQFVPEQKISQLGIRPYLTTLKSIMSRTRSKANVWILLAQLTQDEVAEVAREIQGIDVIVQGHSGFLAGDAYRQINGKVVVNAGVEGQYVGRLDLQLNERKQIIDFDVNLICINNEIFEDDQVGRLTDAYFQELRLLDKLVGPRAKGMPIYGADFCRHCHVLEYDQWKNSKHARAFLSLTTSGKKVELECTSCHSTGSIAKTAGLDPMTAPEMQNVQCEACHIYNVDQIDPATEEHLDSVTAASCRTCHVKQYSPDFDFERYWKRIAH